MRTIGIFTAIIGASLLMVSVAGAEMMCEKMGMMSKGGSGMMGGRGMGMSMMGQMCGEHMGKGHLFFLMNAEELGLSDDQIEKLRKIKSGLKKGYILDSAKLKVAKVELEELLENDSVNMKKAEKKIKEIAGLKGELMLDGVKARVEARKILTSEQWDKASKLIRERMSECRMMGGMEIMEGGGEGMSMEGMELREEGKETDEAEKGKARHDLRHNKRERWNESHH